MVFPKCRENVLRTTQYHSASTKLGCFENVVFVLDGKFKTGFSGTHWYLMLGTLSINEMLDFNELKNKETMKVWLKLFLRPCLRHRIERILGHKTLCRHRPPPR